MGKNYRCKSHQPATVLRNAFVTKVRANIIESSVFVFIARDIWKQFRKKFMRPSTGVKKSVTEPVNFNTFYIQEELNKFAAHGDLENVERLLCLEGIDVNWRDVRYGMTPLICAAASGYDLVHSILRISLVLI